MEIDLIAQHLVDEYKYAGKRLDLQLAKLKNHPDILEEFAEFIKTGELHDKVQVQGYTASQIQEMAPFMQPLGVYNFLITLRDDPEFGLKVIDEGFVRR